MKSAGNGRLYPIRATVTLTLFRELPVMLAPTIIRCHFRAVYFRDTNRMPEGSEAGVSDQLDPRKRFGDGTTAKSSSPRITT